MCSTKKLMYLSQILQVPCTPTEMFKQILCKKGKAHLLMNVANVDKKFGVLNRVLTYRGLTANDEFRFTTVKSAAKYRPLKENPKVALTMQIDLPGALWQIRVYNAIACELHGKEIEELWKGEPLFAKIRSIICESGKINNGVEDLECQYQKLYDRLQKERKEPEQTSAYTAFRIIPKEWEFYYAEPKKIADRIIYKLKENETNKWDIYHIDA